MAQAAGDSLEAESATVDAVRKDGDSDGTFAFDCVANGGREAVGAPAASTDDVESLACQSCLVRTRRLGAERETPFVGDDFSGGSAPPEFSRTWRLERCAAATPSMRALSSSRDCMRARAVTNDERFRDNFNCSNLQ